MQHSLLTLEQPSRSLDIFLSTLKTESTKRNYLFWLNHYLKYQSKASYDDLLKDSPDKIQTDIENFVMYLNEIKTTKSTVKANVYSLFHFFAMNRIILNEKIIKKLIPEQITKVGGNAYSTEDVRKIILAVDETKIKKHKRWYYKKPRARALVHFLASSGVRLGAMVDLKFKDIEPIENCYSVKVYAGTKNEYITFITPEARRSLDEYLSMTNTLDPDDWLFGLNYDSLRACLYRLVKKAKVSTITIHELTDRVVNNYDRKTPRHRLDIPSVHGLRKRWNTILKSNNDINKSLIELMIGHTTMIKLDEAYLKPDKNILFLEYKKGIPSLTVFNDVSI